MKRLAVFISFSGDGGVERMVSNLCAEASKHVQVDLLALKMRGGHASLIPDSVNIIRLNAKHSWSSVAEVADYLRLRKPDALLAAKDRAGRAALSARFKAGSSTPVFIRLGTNLSAALERKDPFSRWLRTAPMRRKYAKADGVIAVSEGVRQDTIKVTGIAPEKVHVIRNPVITPRLAELAAHVAPHDWLLNKQEPVILGMGRLTKQKDFETLLRAFALVRDRRRVRLIILGDGPLPGDREKLESLATRLGVRDAVLLPGFQKNPYAWLSRADLFVLSSAWEGSPNALTEALALGIPSVSTDCPSGPIETLAGGKYGSLVAVGDYQGMARAIVQTLEHPIPANTLREAVREYQATLSALSYLQVTGLLPPHR